VLHVLMQMGHGDDLVICDMNHPAATIAAETTHGRLIEMAGCDIPDAAQAILTLMPMDAFVRAPVSRMQVVGDPTAQMPVFARMRRWSMRPMVARQGCRRWRGLRFMPQQRRRLRSSAPVTRGHMGVSS